MGTPIDPRRLDSGPLIYDEVIIADVLVSKHADHLPLYRQVQVLGRSRVHIARSTLAHRFSWRRFDEIDLCIGTRRLRLPLDIHHTHGRPAKCQRARVIEMPLRKLDHDR